MAHRPRNVRLFARVVAVACLTALLFGDLWRGVHLLGARHVVCAEHGELVDADDRTSSLVARSRAPKGVSEAAPAAPDDHHHEHCAAAAAPAKPSAALIRAAQLALRTSPTAVDAPALAAHDVSTRDVLSYAPKLSPPV